MRLYYSQPNFRFIYFIGVEWFDSWISSPIIWNFVRIQNLKKRLIDYLLKILDDWKSVLKIKNMKTREGVIRSLQNFLALPPNEIRAARPVFKSV